MFRSIEEGADSTLTTICAAAYVVGNMSATYEACHPNGLVSDLKLRPAFGFQCPRAVGKALLALAGLLVFSSLVILRYRHDIVDRLCRSREQVLPAPTSFTDVQPLISNNNNNSSVAIDMSAIDNGNHHQEVTPSGRGHHTRQGAPMLCPD
jgi:hypothetical protein